LTLLSRPTVKTFKNLKIHDSDDRHLEKSKYRHISATVRPIATKFGTLTQFECLTLLTIPFRKSVPVVALFDWFMRLMSRVDFQKHSLYILAENYWGLCPFGGREAESPSSTIVA